MIKIFSPGLIKPKPITSRANLYAHPSKGQKAQSCLLKVERDVKDGEITANELN